MHLLFNKNVLIYVNSLELLVPKLSIKKIIPNQRRLRPAYEYLITKL